MKDYNLAVLVDAKTEYTNQLTNLCKDRIYTCIKELFDSSKKECETTGEKEETLSLFQKKLAEIPKWSHTMIMEEYKKLSLVSKCDWLHELLTAVFMSHSRILSSINPTSETELDLEVPSFENFLHQCYIDNARCFWKSPYLFDDTVTSYDFQRNRRDCELMIEKTLGESIRKQLPVKHILKNYLGDNFKELKNVMIENDINEEERENLKNMIKKEFTKENIESQDNTVSKKTNEHVELEVLECEPIDSVKSIKKADIIKNTDDILVDVEELSLLEEDNELGLELEGLTDLTDSLHDGGVVYGLLNEEEPVQSVKQAVTEELQNIIENQDKDIKRVKINDDTYDHIKVTKINTRQEYNFFSDATPHFIE